MNSPPILVYFSGWIGMFTGGTIWILTLAKSAQDISFLRESAPLVQGQRLTGGISVATRNRTPCSVGCVSLLQTFLKPSGNQKDNSRGGSEDWLICRGVRHHFVEKATQPSGGASLSSTCRCPQNVLTRFPVVLDSALKKTNRGK